MNYKLIHEIPDGNGYRNERKTVAISDNKERLLRWAGEVYGVQPIDNPKSWKEEKEYINDRMWDGWLEICKTNITIV